MKVTEDQFAVISDCEVRHQPTGSTFSADRFPHRTTVPIKIANLNGGNETDSAGNQYDIDEVKAAARDLLQSLADARFR